MNVSVWKLLTPKALRARPSVPAGRRVYAVGDVHGRADLLYSLLARLDDDLTARPAVDTVEVFLGDYIDRGPNSREVIDLLIARRRERNMIFLKGDHRRLRAEILERSNQFAQMEEHRWPRYYLLIWPNTPAARRPTVAASDCNCACSSYA